MCRRGGCAERRGAADRKYSPERRQQRLVQFKVAQTVLCSILLPFTLLIPAQTTAHNLWMKLLVISQPYTDGSCPAATDSSDASNDGSFSVYQRQKGTQPVGMPDRFQRPRRALFRVPAEYHHRHFRLWNSLASALGKVPEGMLDQAHSSPAARC